MTGESPPHASNENLEVARFRMGVKIGVAALAYLRAMGR